MERRYAVDPVRADKGEMPHSDLSSVALVDQRYLGQQIGIELTHLPRGFEMMRIDSVNYFEMPRQKAFEQWHRPTLQCLWQQRVVGVGECFDGDLPSLVTLLF